MTDDSLPASPQSEADALRESLRQRELVLERVMREKGEAVLAELKLSQEVAVRQAENERHDPLTGLLRHGDFRDRFSFEIQRSARTQQSLGLVLVDIDRFGAVNDALGYAEGERVLARISRGVHSILATRPAPRPVVVGREGGNRIGAVISGVEEIEMLIAGEDARAFVERMPSRPRVTARVAVCPVQPGDTLNAVFERCLAGLASMRAEGGNQVVRV